MRIPFIKMHGLGNDFVILDARQNPLPEPAISQTVAAAIANRRTGIGCDQLIVLEPSSAPDSDTDSAPDFTMRIYNNDGSEAGACGNASRAVAILHGRPCSVETAGGIIKLFPTESGAQVDMGAPKFDWQSIPLDYALDTSSMPVEWEGLTDPMAVNVGNPHIIFFTDNCEDVDLARIGPDIEHDPLFPERVNVNVADIQGNGINLRVWERGAGLTRACGTGACATAVAAIKRGLVSSPVAVTLPGGTLTISWAPGENIIMEGPAAESFRGSFEWSDFA